jgi:hypothetical protein
MSPFRPMTQFDPSRPALVHDRLNAKRSSGRQNGEITSSGTSVRLASASSHGTVCYWMGGRRSKGIRSRITR